uniref:Rho guanine nucleotide exchange factor 12 n=1 Tax=Scleropages formosus TaxID=113540 RepID=A0A8C9WQ38_SCLFO
AKDLAPSKHLDQPARKSLAHLIVLLFWSSSPPRATLPQQCVSSSHWRDPLILIPLLFLSAGLVQRCVIIQKDDNGFGLTVSGDNPVFVQLVKEGKHHCPTQWGSFISLLTHSNHVEVVKLIKSGSYVALTVLGRPPGLPQIPLSEGEGDSINSPQSPSPAQGERSAGTTITAPVPVWEENNIMHNQKVDILQKMLSKEQQELQAMKEEYSKNPTPKLLKEIQEAKKHIPQLQGELSKATGGVQDGLPSPRPGDTLQWSEAEDGCSSDEVQPFYHTTTAERWAVFTVLVISWVFPHFQDSQSQSSVGSPSSRLAPLIIGAEDEDFTAEQEQLNGQCSCFQSIELLKSRPAHLAAFLHHVVSQFDPAPLLCYLYADLYKQVNAKETRRMFVDFCSFFMDRTAVSEAQRRRPEMIPEELHRQYVQLLQDTLLADIQRHLEDFRQKRSMGLTLAEGELARLDTERVRSRVALERERSCAEHIISKIEDVLTSQPTEEEKCTTMQYVILTYMKHLGVRVKEPRSLEPKRVRINFLPKIKKSIKPEKEGEEKVKKPRFPSILVPPRRPSRNDATSSRSIFVPLLKGSGGGHSQGFQEVSSCMLLLTYCCSLHVYGYVWVLLSMCSSHGPELCHMPASTPSRMDTVTSADVQSEDDQGNEFEFEQDPPNWQQLVSREVLAGLTPHEIKRQEVINELFYTERAHLRMLRVLDSVFYQKLTRDAILPPADIKNIFTNLEEIIQLHGSISEQMTAIRKKNETTVIDLIGEDLLSWFSGDEEEKIKRAVGTFCSNQPFALELIKTRQKKDQRFTSFILEAESNRLCRRLQLKDIIPVEMQRLTKYPLLLESIAKYTGWLEKVKRAGECCRKILNYVNQAVKESENKQVTEWKHKFTCTCFPPLLQNLDLTKKKMVHEGPLSWKVNKDKTIELYTLLLEDILVLLQKQDDRLILKCHSKNLAGTADTKHIFSPVIKLNTVLVRSVATDNKSFFVLSMSENGAQIYELMAQTVSEQRTWQCLITQQKDGGTSPTGMMQNPPVGTNPFDDIKSEGEEDEGPEQDGEDGPFLEPSLSDRLPQSQLTVTLDDDEQDTFVYPSSAAEEALQTCEWVTVVSKQSTDHTLLHPQHDLCHCGVPHHTVPYHLVQ